MIKQELYSLISTTVENEAQIVVCIAVFSALAGEILPSLDYPSKTLKRALEILEAGRIRTTRDGECYEAAIAIIKKSLQGGYTA